MGAENDIYVRLKAEGIETVAQLEAKVKELNQTFKNSDFGSQASKNAQVALVQHKELLTQVRASVQTENTKMMGSYFSLGESIRSVQSAMMGAFAFVGGASVFAHLVEKGAQAEQNFISLDRVMRQFGKNTVDELEKVKKSAGNLIDDSDVAHLMTKALRLGVPIESLAHLMEIARVKSRDFGGTVAENFDLITEAIGRGNVKQLTSLGLIDKFDNNVKNLTEDAIANAGAADGMAIKHELLAAVLRNGDKDLTQFNKDLFTTTERIQQVKVAFEESKEWIGGAIIKGGLTLVSALSMITSTTEAGRDKAAGEMLSGASNQSMWDAMNKGTGKLPSGGGRTQSTGDRRGVGVYGEGDLAGMTSFMGSGLTDRFGNRVTAPVVAPESMMDKLLMEERKVELQEDEIATLRMKHDRELKRAHEEAIKAWKEENKTATAAMEVIGSGLDSVVSGLMVTRQGINVLDSAWIAMENTAIRALENIASKLLETAVISFLMNLILPGSGSVGSIAAGAGGTTFANPFPGGVPIFSSAPSSGGSWKPVLSGGTSLQKIYVEVGGKIGHDAIYLSNLRGQARETLKLR